MTKKKLIKSLREAKFHVNAAAERFEVNQLTKEFMLRMVKP